MSQKKAAQKRWGILANVIKSKDCNTDVTGSKRSFQSYNIVKVEPLEDETEAGEAEWKTVSYREVSVPVRYLRPKLELSHLVGFNNTGNVCVWPSEESLAVFCLNNIHLFEGKQVLEVGGGMSALAGCLLAASGAPASTSVSDGNMTSVTNLEMIVKRLSTSAVCDNIDAFQLRWDESVDHLESRYDVILSADCLFFKESALSLVKALHLMLRPQGKVYIAAPNRESTFEFFKDLAKDLFHLEEVENYSTEVTKAHESYLGQPGYNEDIHYPRLLILTR